jgi:hypothetical protein
LQPGPLATYRGWQEKGRQVRKGEKAITLCRPVTRSFEDDQGEKKITATGFIERPFWFVLDQTDGPPIEFPTTPRWDRERALAALSIREVPFAIHDGKPIEFFLLDPPLPVELDALGIGPRGVHLIEKEGVWHVFDVVGQENYPNVCDVIEEARYWGISRRCELLDYSLLTAESRLVLLHQRAFIRNFADYPPLFGEHERRDFRCPKNKHALDSLEGMCAGLWRHDFEEGIEPSTTIRPIDGGWSAAWSTSDIAGRRTSRRNINTRSSASSRSGRSKWSSIRRMDRTRRSWIGRGNRSSHGRCRNNESQVVNSAAHHAPGCLRHNREPGDHDDCPCDPGISHDC